MECGRLRIVMKTKRILVSLSVLAVLASASLRAMPQIGDLSPRFEAMDQNTNYVKLADYLGKKNVILYFYPKDFSPECIKEACGFQERLGDLHQNDVVVIGVSIDSIESHFKFANQYNLKFPLIADTEGKIAHAFGAKAKGACQANRISFLIDKQGRIVQITESNDAETHFKEMQTAIYRLKAQGG